MEAKVLASPDFGATIDKHGSASSDGSGGPPQIPKSITQVGVGAVAFGFTPKGHEDFELEDLACIGGQVPGKQTVPRAELWGAIQTLTRPIPAPTLVLG